MVLQLFVLLLLGRVLRGGFGAGTDPAGHCWNEGGCVWVGGDRTVEMIGYFCLCLFVFGEGLGERVSWIGPI